MATIFRSYVAIGDSFTEGVGDELPDGRPRGWADLVALGLALAARESEREHEHEPFTYANLAIRGRLLAPIVGEQLDAAVQLRPQLISINGGGNDILRPRVSVASIADRLEAAADTAVKNGIHVLLLSGGNPTRHIPLGTVFNRRGEELRVAVIERMPKPGITLVDNWGDRELENSRYWSRDKLHLNALGHQRVASNALAALEVPIPPIEPGHTDGEPTQRTAAYWRHYVLPWIGRRLTGRSSGDNREPKIATLQPVEVPGPPD